MGAATKHFVRPDRVKPSFCNFRHPGTLTLRAERQSARMSKITNDAVAQLLYSCTRMTTAGVEWLTALATVDMVAGTGRVVICGKSDENRCAWMRLFTWLPW